MLYELERMNISLILLILVLLSTSHIIEAQGPVSFCYYSSWAQYRADPAKFFPEDIDPALCTHILFAFASIENNELVPSEFNDEDLYTRFNAIKLVNPDVVTLLAVGGWNMNMDEVSPMMASAENRTQFTEQSSEFLYLRGFDGINLDFEFPGSRNGRPEDKPNFSLLLQEMNQHYSQFGLLVTVSVAASKQVIERGYEIPQVCQYADFVQVMTYDFAGPWEPVTEHSSPFCPRLSQEGDTRYNNMQSATYLWVNGGCMKEKMGVGIGVYGYAVTLAAPVTDKKDWAIGVNHTGAAPAGFYTAQQGFYSSYEICARNRSTDGEITLELETAIDEEHLVPYMKYYDDNESQYVWVGYEDETSARRKVSWIRQHGFGGVMVWDFSLEDFLGYAEWCDRGRYPLITAMKDEWNNSTTSCSDIICPLAPIGVPSPGCM